MKAPLVDYRNFRPGRINEPQYRHIWLLLSWPGYFLMYLLTENLIPYESCRPVHCAFDDLIPFCEIFIIPYVLWYLLVALSLAYFFFCDVDSFKKLQSYIIITQILAMLIYILFPNRQDLRPDVFPRENIFTAIVGFIYSIDTSTGVCPSLHCAYSIGIASVWLKKKDAAKPLRAFIFVFCILVCMSTGFVKQHSFLDFIAALPLCLLAELLVFRLFFPAPVKKPPDSKAA